MKQRMDSEGNGDVDNARRSVALGLIAALGGSTLLKGCAGEGAASVGSGSALEAELESMAQSLTGTTTLRWFDKAKGTPPSDLGLADYTGSAASEVAVLLGYHTPGDGGGGVFYWDPLSTAAANDGTIFGSQPQGRWNRVYSGAVDVRWFGAKGNGVADDRQAIAAAMAASLDVVIPEGTFKTTAVLSLRSDQLVRGAGASSVVASAGNDYAFRIADVGQAEIRDLTIRPASAGNGILIHANAAAVFYPRITRVLIEFGPSGASIGIKMRTEHPTNGACVYNARITDCQVLGANSNYNLSAKGIVAESVSGAYIHRNIGARITYGRFAYMHSGIVLDHCDGASIVGATFDSLMEVGGAPSTANTGRAIVFGTNTRLCFATDVRTEDVDVPFENNAQFNGFHSLQGYSVDQIVDPGGAQREIDGKAPATSRDNRQVLHGRRHTFTRSVELGFYENKNASSGTTLYGLADNSGVVSPLVRIVGPTAAFSLGSIKIESPTDPNNQLSGCIKYVYNTTPYTMTVKHQDGSAPVAEERIVTLTGADVAVPGPAVLKFIYDQDVRGFIGARRWIYIGAG